MNFRTKFCSLLTCVLLMMCLLAASVYAKTEITYWTFLDPNADGPREEAQRQQIANFEAANPGIKVNIEVVHWSRMVPMLITASSAGRGPDVALNFSPRMAMVIEAGAAQPLDRFISDWSDEQKSDFIVPWDEQLYKGSLWSLHSELRIQNIFYYREDLLQKIGRDVPKTWDEVAETAIALREGPLWGFAWPLSRKESAAGIQGLLAMWRDAGGEFLNEDGTPAFNGPEGVKILNWFKDLKEAGGMPPSMLSAEEWLTGLKAGAWAMGCEGTHRVEPARAAGLGQKLKTAPMPSFKPGRPAPALVAGQSFMIGKHSKHPEEAWKFIEHMISPESQLINATLAGQVPTRKSTLQDDWFKGPEAAEMLEWLDYAMNYGESMYYNEQWITLVDAIAMAFEEVLVNDRPVQESLDKAANAYLEALNL
jgi:ABC-type glycerol-3-phosphate transport system substrate-binding protein